MCVARNYHITMERLIFWNTYYLLDDIIPMFADVVARTPALKSKYGNILFNRKKLPTKDRCTGFIATGDVTKDEGSWSLTTHSTLTESMECAVM